MFVEQVAYDRNLQRRSFQVQRSNTGLGKVRFPNPSFTHFVLLKQMIITNDKFLRELEFPTPTY